MSGVLAQSMPVKMAERDLEHVLEQLYLGETLTLISSEGAPLALVVSLKPAPVEAEPIPDWEDRWDALVKKVSRAWKSEKGAVEILTEMRR